MGGDAFGIPATRLTPLAYWQLCEHVVAALRDTDTAIPPPLPKESHGDVDVLVSSSLLVSKGCGMGGPAAELTELAELESKADVDGLCSELCRRIGGEKWSRLGKVVSIAIPLSSLSFASPTAGFYQVDLILVPRRSLRWAQMSMTYGQAPQLLKLLCRAVGGGRMSVQATHLGFVQRKREMELTSSPGELCAWLGLASYDPDDFGSQEGMEPLYAWLGSAPPNSRAGARYAHLVAQWRDGTLPLKAGRGKGAPMSKRQQKLRLEDDMAEAFCGWLAAHNNGHSGAAPRDGGDEGTEWRARCPELSDEEIRTLLYFDKMEAYLATQS